MADETIDIDTLDANPHALLANLLDEVGSVLPLPVRHLARAMIGQLDEGDAWRIVGAVQVYLQAITTDSDHAEALEVVAACYPDAAPVIDMIAAQGLDMSDIVRKMQNARHAEA